MMADPSSLPLKANSPAKICDLRAALCLTQLPNEDTATFFSRCTDQLNQFWSHNEAHQDAKPLQMRRRVEAEVEAKNHVLKVVFVGGLRLDIRQKMPDLFACLGEGRGRRPDLETIVKGSPVSMLADAAAIVEGTQV